MMFDWKKQHINDLEEHTKAAQECMNIIVFRVQHVEKVIEEEG